MSRGGAFEVDHVFVTVGKGAAAMDALREAGFHEGPPNTHHGQGTACRRVFFENAYLELLWLDDAAAAAAPPVDRTGLLARAGGGAEASRIGIALRARDGVWVEPPVPTWRYRPPYLPDGLAIPMATRSTVVAEPLLFFMPWQRRWSAPRIPHPNGARAVTGIALTVRADPAPGAGRWLREQDGFRVTAGDAEGLEIDLDGCAAGRSLSLEPEVPLRLRW